MGTQASEPTGQKLPGTPADELAMMIQRARVFTNASGAAVGSVDPGTGEIVCRACSGSSAPDVGARMRVEGTFYGICIETGKELRCDNAETDTRVDTQAIRSLGIRSIVIIPVKVNNRVLGVMAVFSPTRYAFTATHVAVLMTMANRMAALLQEESATQPVPRNAVAPASEAPVIEKPPARPLIVPPSVPAPVAAAPAMAPVPPPAFIPPKVAAPVQVVPLAETVDSSRRTPVLGEKHDTARGSSNTAPAPHPGLPPKAEPLRAVPVDAVAPHAPLPEKKPERKITEEKSESFRPDSAPAVKFDLGTLDAAGGTQKQGNKFPLLAGIAVAVLIAGGAVVGYMKFGGSSVPTQAPLVQQAKNPALAQPAAAAPGTASGTVASLPAANPADGASTTPAPSAPVADSSTSVKPSRPSNSGNASGSARSGASERAENRKTEPVKNEKPQLKIEALSGAPSKIRAGGQEASAEAAPSLGIGGSGAQLSSLAHPVNNTKPAILSQSQMVPAQVIRSVPPVYPSFAKDRHLNGLIRVKFTIGRDGTVRNPKFVNGSAIFQDSAFAAVKQWLYKPAMLNGQAVEQEMEVILHFNQ
ncbi:MAG TPA: TonB family protein [Candidatus Angelobacter sp.]|nr:TonB family protein [Candidatus Angelobacter sp.]